MYKTDSQWLRNSKRLKPQFNYKTHDTRCLFTEEAAAFVEHVPGPDKYSSKSNLELVYSKVRACSIHKSNFPRCPYGKTVTPTPASTSYNGHDSFDKQRQRAI